MGDKRSEPNKASVRALRKLLLQVCKTPEKYHGDKALKKALKSQGGLYAVYENERLGIKSSSINTVKRVAAEIISGGFDEFDNLRKSAKENIEEELKKDDRPNKRTRIGLKILVDQYEDEIQELRQVNFALLQSVSEVTGDIRSIAKTRNEEVRQAKSDQAIKKIMAMLTMNPAPFNEIEVKSNVTTFTPK